MTTADRPTPGPTGRAGPPFTPDPASFLAVAGALEAIRDAVDAAESGTAGTGGGGAGAEDVLASLLLLRQLREQLAVWEPGLVETAREAGASWAELAHPLGVASRQAAERRYLR
ncbi:type III effector protein, partial [Streptomyces albidoflavus]